MNKVDRKIPSRLTEYGGIVSDAIENYITDRRGRLYEMVNYHLGFDRAGGDCTLSGKAIRSSLVLFTAEAFGGDPDQALPAAVSLELVHNFSLVHDDIQDDAGTRRGRESVQKKWSPGQAINAGDGIKDLATLAVTQLSDGRPERALEAIEAVSNYSLRMIQGQVMDLHYAKQEKIGIDGYLEMIRGKTCALLEASFHLGGIYAGVDGDQIEKLSTFGRLLGYVYQIRDDWLGIWGRPEDAGKSVRSDLVEKKKTFPVVYALQEGEGLRLSNLEEIYSGPGKLGGGEVERARRILEEIGAREKTNEWAEKYWSKAERQLREMDMEERAKTELKELGSFLLKRQK